MTTADGGTRWIEVHLLPHLGEQRESVGAFVLISDITQAPPGRAGAARIGGAAGEVHAGQRRRHRLPQGRLHHRCESAGLRADGLHARGDARPQDASSSSRPTTSRRCRRSSPRARRPTYESVLLDKQRQRIPVEFIVRTMVRNGESMRMTIVRDIRDRHAAQARIHHLAHHDALTGLPNRMSFMEHLEHSMAGARGRSIAARAAVHRPRPFQARQRLARPPRRRRAAAHGGRAHRRRAARHRRGRALRRRRVHGAAAGLPTDPARREDVEQVAEKLLAAIEAPIDADGRPLSVTPSIGIALYPRRRRHADRADQACRLGDVPRQGAWPRQPPVLRPGDGERRPTPRW